MLVATHLASVTRADRRPVVRPVQIAGVVARHHCWSFKHMRTSPSSIMINTRRKKTFPFLIILALCPVPPLHPTPLFRRPTTTTCIRATATTAAAIRWVRAAAAATTRWLHTAAATWFWIAITIRLRPTSATTTTAAAAATIWTTTNGWRWASSSSV